MRTLVKVGLIAWNGLMALWFVTWIVGLSTSNDCAASAFQESCESGRSAGIGIAFVMFIVVAAAGNVVLGVLWLVGRPTSRPCPVCGAAVTTGATRCSACGHDFRASTVGGRWAKDPLDRHELRYWDGRAWTESVSDAGIQAKDPVS